MNILSVYIDDILSKKEFTPNMYLCKPDKSRIFKLKDIYDLKLNLKLGAINELSFSIPSHIERNHSLIENPLITEIKLYYLVEFQFKGSKEYFVVMNQGKSMSNDEETISYNLLSSGYLLNNKLIKLYEVTSYTLSQLVFDFLEETDWGIDHIDVEFDVNNSNSLKRSYETDNSTVLQCLFDVAQKFNAIIFFDTVNQKVSFYQPEKNGLNRGWKLKKGKFLESYNVDINIDEIVTRMYCYGNEGLEFRSLSPTGSNYLEDFSWYMYPFECDDNYNIIQHSEYMSDALCIALLKHNKLLNQNANNFKDLSTSLSTKKAELITLNQELSVYDTELKMLHNELDIMNATYLDEATSKSEWQTIINKINNKNVEIHSKKNQIDSKENEIKKIETSIATLHNLLDVENNFTKSELLELNKYIICKDFSDDTIVEEQDLLDASTKYFKVVNEPAITMSFKITNFLNDMEYVGDRDKINLGDTVKLISNTLDISISSKVIEISYDFDNNDVSLIIANDKDLQDDNSKLVNMIYSSHNTSTTVNMNKYKLDLAVNANNLVTHMINSNFDTARNVLLGGTANSNTMTERGFYSKDLQDEKAFLVINNGILAITKDAGNSVEVAINKNGVFANRLYGRMILGNKLVIESDNGLFTIDGTTQTVYDANGVKKIELGKYQDPDSPSQYKYGLRIYDGAFDIRTTDNPSRGVQIDGKGIRTFNSNGVRTFNVEAATGLVEIIGSLSIRTSTSTNRGVVIDGTGIKGYNASGGLTFEISNNGDAWFAGRLEWATGNIKNVGGTFSGDLVAAGGTFTGTLNGVDGVFTGSLSAASGTFQGLVTGSLSAETMKAINIDTDQITSGFIRANKIQVDSLSSLSSNLGNVTSGSIDIDTDLKVGNNIYLGEKYYGAEKQIIFNNTARIVSTGWSMNISAPEVYIGSAVTIGSSGYTTRFFGHVDFSGATVSGLY
ncbi:phage tail protein [Lysinibacillus fusiformis]|uniref:phage tail protein n=1 Tax=Lysinibacillus fusiformis TaxID=28031 RepID=UPI00381E07EC